jgi:hypothetical protein
VRGPRVGCAGSKTWILPSLGRETGPATWPKLLPAGTQQKGLWPQVQRNLRQTQARVSTLLDEERGQPWRGDAAGLVISRA